MGGFKSGPNVASLFRRRHRPRLNPRCKRLSRQLENAQKQLETLEVVFVIDDTVSMKKYFKPAGEAVRSVLSDPETSQLVSALFLQLERPIEIFRLEQPPLDEHFAETRFCG